MSGPGQDSRRARSVLMLSAPFPPAASAGTFRSLRFVKYLPFHGWRPCVVTVRADREAGRDGDRGLLEQVPRETDVRRAGVWRPGVALRSLGSSVARGGGDSEAPAAGSSPVPPRTVQGRQAASALFRWLFETPDADVGWLPGALLASLRLVREKRIDVVYSTSPPYTSHLAGVLVKMLTRRPLVLDFRDPWARGIWKRAGESTARLHVAAALESLCIRWADRVILNTERARGEFRASYPDEDPRKFRTLPNGYDPDDLREVERLAAERDASAGFLLCHPGTVYGARGFSGLLAAIESLTGDGPDVRLLQIGVVGSRQAAELREWTGRSGLGDRVRVESRRPHDEVLRSMARSDALLVLQPDAPLQVPGKLYEMLMFRKPILALAGEGETADLVRTYGIGEVAAADSPEGIAAALRRLHAASPQPGDWAEPLARHDGEAQTARLARLLAEAARLDP